MGNNQSLNSIQSLYSFVQNYRDPTFGDSKIYKSNFYQNQFVVQYTLNFPHDQVQKIKNSIKNLQQNLISQNETFPFLKIVHTNIEITNQLTKTCSIPQITIWVEFLRHNLKQFLNWRISQNKPLCLDQVKMAIQKAIKAYHLSKKNQHFGVSLKLEEVSITIDGEIKFNPLLGKELHKSSFNFVNEEDNTVKNKILQKRSYNSSQQNSHNKIINLNSRRDFHSQSLQNSEETEFLYQLKKFVNKIILQCSCKQENPEDSYFFDAKDIRIFLDRVNGATSLKEMMQITGKSPVDKFMVDFSKLKHQESQSRFSKILSELQQKSQRTDYSLYASPFKQKSGRKVPNLGYFHISPSQHQYY